MIKIDPIKNWLDTVGFNHSDSQQTRRIYKSNLQKFLKYAETTAENILQEYNTSTTEREFKQKYTPIIMSLIGKMKKQNLAQATQHNIITAIKSFFKYNSLPLGYAPSGKQTIEFHNRDIEKQEIEEIIKRAEPREQAYYTLMAQSGLRPQTISKLIIRDLEKLLDENTPIPCLIKIPQDKTKGKYSEYFTFTGKESITYIKKYLKGQRNQPTPEDYLFTMYDGKTPVKPDIINHTFKRTIEKLKVENILNFKKIKKDMPNKKRKSVSRNELRLYSLRKYFRNHAGHAGFDYINFWMGHIAELGTDKHYFNQTDIEEHRRRYKEIMQFLNIETTTPDQFTPIVTDLQNKLTQQEARSTHVENENKELKERLTKIESDIENIIKPEQNEYDKYLEEHPEIIEQMEEQDKQLEKEMKIRKKWEKEYPEEFKQQKEQQEKQAKEVNKYLEEHPEITEMTKQDLEQHIEHIETENKELRERLTKIEKLLNITRQTEKTEKGEINK